MKVLLLCNKPPYPPTEGGSIAMNMIVEGLAEAGHQVKVLAFNSNKTNVQLNTVPPEYIEKTGIELIPIDLSIRPGEAFMNLFTSKSYHVERFISKRFEKRLIEVLQQEKFDVVQFEMLYMAPYLHAVRKYSNATAILRAHNIEHLVWERVRRTTSSYLRKIYLNHLVRTLKKYELSVSGMFDGIAAITWKDAEFFREHLPEKKAVEAIPFGIDPEMYPVTAESGEFPSLFSIGAMDWMPNAEGIRWFLDEVWPLIHDKYPHLPYFIAGRHMPDWITCCNRPGVTVTGEVRDAREFMLSKSVMIVPLLSGSGIRIKIIEGMANSRAIISTSIGAEGIHHTHGKDIFIADTPAEFLKAVDSLMDPVVCRQTGMAARALIEREYTRSQIISNLTAFYEKAGS